MPSDAQVIAELRRQLEEQVARAEEQAALAKRHAEAAREKTALADRYAEDLRQREALTARYAAELREKERLAKRLSDDVEEKARTITDLRHRLDLLARQLFGQKAERVDPNQLKLAFDKAAEEGETPPPFVEEAPDEEAQPSGRPRRRKRNGRLKLPRDLPRERREILPEADELVCPCGYERRRIGEEVTEQLDYRPACFKVIEHARIKYACPACQEGVVCPPLPGFPIDKKRPSRPSAALLAEVIVSKYGDHLPLARQEDVFARHGVRIPKTTLCDWIRDVAEVLEPIAEEVGREVLRNPVVQTDETGIRVRDPTVRGRTVPGRIWVYAGQRGQAHFRYTPTKETKHPAAFLADYQGYLQADAYSGFDRLYKDGSIVEVACWAHARRKFFDAKETSPTHAVWALHAIGRIFEIDREGREAGLDAEGLRALREEKARPIVESFFEWLEGLKEAVLPRSPIYAAIRYALNQREALCRFLEDGRLRLDNNRAERSLRQVAVGRKNWLFAGSAMGGHRAATLYTLVVSCKELGISPTEYLADVLDKIAAGFPNSRRGELTPYGWTQARQAAATTV